jgi:hypothetical protein
MAIFTLAMEALVQPPADDPNDMEPAGAHPRMTDWHCTHGKGDDTRLSIEATVVVVYHSVL